MIAAAVVGCDDQDGRALPEPADTTTTTVASTTTTTSGVIVQPPDDGKFRIESPVVAPGTELPVTFTCFGEGISPPLAWDAVPDGFSTALVVRDLDADGFVHWIVTGIDPSVRGWGEGGLPEQVVEGPNDAGGTGWTPPCPPSGTHRYVFTIHALAEPIEPQPDLTAEQAARLIERRSAEQAVLTALVTPPE